MFHLPRLFQFSLLLHFTHHINVHFLAKDYVAFLMMALFAASNGWCSTLAMIYGPQQVWSRVQVETFVDWHDTFGFERCSTLMSSIEQGLSWSSASSSASSQAVLVVKCWQIASTSSDPIQRVSPFWFAHFALCLVGTQKRPVRSGSVMALLTQLGVHWREDGCDGVVRDPKSWMETGNWWKLYFYHLYGSLWFVSSTFDHFWSIHFVRRCCSLRPVSA